MEQRISLVTLGVADVPAARAFYERLGWRCGLDVEATAFFQLGGTIFTLWDRALLAADSGVASDRDGWGGVTLAHNVGSPGEVDAVVEEARAAGATVAVEPRETAYGGYAGVFHDPDGPAGEVAWNPGVPLADDGTTSLPSAPA